MKLTTFWGKFLLAWLPFLAILAVPIYQGELVPMRAAVWMQTELDMPIIYGPNYGYADYIFAYTDEMLDRQRASLVIFGSSRATQLQSRMFDLAPDDVYNASDVGWDFLTAEELLYSMDTSNLPDVILINLDQHLFRERPDAVTLDVNQHTINEIPLDQVIFNTIYRAYEDLLDRDGWAIGTLRRDGLLPDDMVGIGVRAMGGANGFRLDGSKLNHRYTVWDPERVADDIEVNLEHLVQRRDIFTTRDAVEPTSFDTIERILAYAHEHNITVVGYFPPFGPMFYDIMAASGDYTYIDEATVLLADLFTAYDGHFYDFTNPYLFSLHEHDFIDHWHPSERVSAQIVLYMAYAQPDIFAPYIGTEALATLLLDNQNPNHLYDPAPPVMDAMPIPVATYGTGGLTQSELYALGAYRQSLDTDDTQLDQIAVRIINQTLEDNPNSDLPLETWLEDLSDFN